MLSLHLFVCLIVSVNHVTSPSGASALGRQEVMAMNNSVRDDYQEFIKACSQGLRVTFREFLEDRKSLGKDTMFQDVERSMSRCRST